ncbi:GPI mannosyltransferase 4 isoform X2 [Haliaeetus albicilla]|uniref:GPI mannosyltransferase 4 isoform X2 n=1 Tax=Haliaeetus albicilla TaxID=8969 RepID=UPI0037E70236
MAKLLLFSLLWAVNACPSRFWAVNACPSLLCPPVSLAPRTPALQREGGRTRPAPPFWMRELCGQQRAGTRCPGPRAPAAGQGSPRRGDDAFPCLWVSLRSISEFNFTLRCPGAAGAVPRSGGRCACAPGSRCGARAAGRAPPGGAGRAERAPVRRRRWHAGQGAVGAAGRPAGRLVPAAAGRLPTPRRVLPVARGDGSFVKINGVLLKLSRLTTASKA